MKVLVTGGTGYLGSAIVRALGVRGHTPVVFARHASARAPAPPAAAVDGDIRNQTAVVAAAAGCDAICHTAALVSLWRPRPADFDEVNVGGLRHVLRAAAAHRLPRVLYTSSFLALPPAGGGRLRRTNDYQRTKQAAEAVATEAIETGAPLIRTYPGVVYGPGPATEGNLVGRLLADHLAGRLPGLVGAGRLWSFAFIEDVAAGHVTALERGRVGGRYVLGGENAPQMRPFELLREATGRTLPRRVPVAAALTLALVQEGRARLRGRAPLLTRAAVEIFRHDWPLDSGVAIAELDYRITPLAEGFRRTLGRLTAGAG